MSNGRHILDFVRAFWIDVLLLMAVGALGVFFVYVPADFAANLPQDAGDFAIPALTYLERGRMVVPAFGSEFAMGHPVGLPILLVPVYLLSGHFIGNGIYLILLFAIASIVLVYVIGRQLGGRICGSLASLFLVSHCGFQQYSQKIMSEVPSMFLLTAVFAMTLRLAKGKQAWHDWLLFGAVLGLTLVVRYDNVLVLAPLLVLWATGLLPVGSRGFILALIGLAPWFCLQAAYNVHNYGSIRRTGYDYAGNTGSAQCPMFSLQHVLTRSYLKSRDLPLSVEGRIDGNLSLYGKTLLNEADITLPFSNDPRWVGKPRKTYVALIIARTVFGIIGLAACVVWWRRNERARWLLLWVCVLGISMLAFYSVYFWQEERFLLRLATFFCLLDGLGAYALTCCFIEKPQWAKVTAVVSVLGVIGTLIASLFYYSAKKLVLQSDDNLVLYAEMRAANFLIERNAVLITNYDPPRTDVHIIRGTDRIAVQLGDDANYSYVPEVGGRPRPMSPLKAVDRPEVLIQCLHEGRPVYLLSKYVVAPQAMPEFQVLSKNLVFEPMAWAAVTGQPGQPYLFRVRSTGLPFLIE